MPEALLLHLPTPDDIWWIPRPPESHHVFGAGILLVAALMAGEALAGEVWHRNMARRMMFPAILVLLGWGLVMVAFIEPYARLIHVTMGLPMIVGGWAEWRYRLGEMDRKYADYLIIPALSLAAFDTLSFHLAGPVLVIISHIGIGVLVFLLAGLRWYQSARPQSVMRALLISFALVLLVGDLWLDAFFQGNV
jgi:hypothetical protein